MKADFHIHSSMSDGLFTPETLIRQAHEKRVDIMAFTDHECMTLSPALLDMAEFYHIRLVPGLELLTHYQGRDVHVLAYFAGLPGECLMRAVRAWRNRRTQATCRLIARLREMGIDMDMPDAPDKSAGKTHTHSHVLYGLHHSFPHLDQQALRDIIASAFAAEPLEDYVPPSFEEAVDLIRCEGGLPVIAHPGLLQDFSLVEKLLSLHPVGLEVYYGYWYNTEELIEQYARLAHTSALAATGGSDFHGAFSRFSIGDIDFPEEQVAFFLDLLRKIRVEEEGL